MKARGEAAVSVESALRSVVDRGRFTLTVEPGDPPGHDIVRDIHAVAGRMGIVVDIRRSSRTIAIRLGRGIPADPERGRAPRRSTRPARSPRSAVPGRDATPAGEQLPSAADIRRAMNIPPSL